MFVSHGMTVAALPCSRGTGFETIHLQCELHPLPLTKSKLCVCVCVCVCLWSTSLPAANFFHPLKPAEIRKFNRL